MERNPTQADWRTVRAARSLYINQINEQIVQRRIENATATITSYMALTGVALVRLGRYEVETDGDELHVSQLPATGERQLELPAVTEEELSASEALDALVAMAAGDDGLEDEELLSAVDELRDLLTVRFEEGGEDF